MFRETVCRRCCFSSMLFVLGWDSPAIPVIARHCKPDNVCFVVSPLPPVVFWWICTACLSPIRSAEAIALAVDNMVSGFDSIRSVCFSVLFKTYSVLRTVRMLRLIRLVKVSSDVTMLELACFLEPHDGRPAEHCEHPSLFVRCDAPKSCKFMFNPRLPTALLSRRCVRIRVLIVTFCFLLGFVAQSFGSLRTLLR